MDSPSQNGADLYALFLSRLAELERERDGIVQEYTAALAQMKHERKGP